MRAFPPASDLVSLQHHDWHRGVNLKGAYQASLFRHFHWPTENALLRLTEAFRTVQSAAPLVMSIDTLSDKIHFILAIVAFTI